jgi:signal transduction histidine kinase
VKPQLDYSKLFDPIKDITTSVEALLDGAFGGLRGDQREQLKDIHRAAWGYHTLIMDIVTSLGIERITRRPALRPRFDQYLQTIIARSGALLNGIDGPITDEQRVSIDYIHSIGKRLQGYTPRLWLYSQLDQDIDLHPVTACDLLTILQPLQMPIAAPPIAMEWGLPEQLPLVWACPTYARLCLQELLTNAIAVTTQGAIQVRAQENDQHVLVRVQDSGIGIDHADLTAITRPFYQIASADGLGLGLHLVQRLMTHQRGKFAIMSRPDEGTIAHVLFAKISE